MSDNVDRANAVVGALALEYQTLRSEILARASQRQGFLTIAGALAALLAGFGGKASSAPPLWVWAIVIVLFVTAAFVWWRSGQAIATISDRLSWIEGEINKELRTAFSAETVGLGWETLQKNHRAGNRWYFLHGPVSGEH